MRGRFVRGRLSPCDGSSERVARPTRARLARLHRPMPVEGVGDRELAGLVPRVVSRCRSRQADGRRSLRGRRLDREPASRRIGSGGRYGEGLFGVPGRWKALQVGKVRESFTGRGVEPIEQARVKVSSGELERGVAMAASEVRSLRRRRGRRGPAFSSGGPAEAGTTA